MAPGLLAGYVHIMAFNAQVRATASVNGGVLVFQVEPSPWSCCVAAELAETRSSMKPAQEPENQSWQTECFPSVSAFPLQAMGCEGGCKNPWLWALS